MKQRTRTRWNHNLHYHPVVLRAAPTPCALTLDVGCGEGVLTRELAQVSTRVVGIDIDGPSIRRAQEHSKNHHEYICGDLFDHPFEPESFDFVTSVAALHHMDLEAGLTRMASLVRPGGVLAVIGLARPSSGWDYALSGVGVLSSQFHRRHPKKVFWEHSAPQIWPPPHDYAEVRETARRLLPGVSYQRHVLFRYSLIWQRNITP